MTKGGLRRHRCTYLESLLGRFEPLGGGTTTTATTIVHLILSHARARRTAGSRGLFLDLLCTGHLCLHVLDGPLQFGEPRHRALMCMDLDARLAHRHVAFESRADAGQRFQLLDERGEVLFLGQALVGAWVGAWERGRVGEWASGRVGAWARGQARG